MQHSGMNSVTLFMSYDSISSCRPHNHFKYTPTEIFGTRELWVCSHVEDGQDNMAVQWYIKLLSHHDSSDRKA